MRNERTKVSAIICTLDRREILPETIPSIERSPSVDELIIVEGLKPIGYSRDVAWRKARNQIICFIDDDEVVPDGWIERLANEFNDGKVGAVWSTLKPLNENKINTLECLLQNHTLKKFHLQARFVRKRALEETGGYEHTQGGETVYAAQKMMRQGWKIKIVDYPFLHKMHQNGYAWILNIYCTGKLRANEILENKEQLSYFKKTLGSLFRGFQLSTLYKEPLFIAFYPLRCWLYLIGIIYGSVKEPKKRENPHN